MITDRQQTNKQTTFGLLELLSAAKKLVSFMTFIKSYYLMPVASDESGDGNGAFYLPGGELMPQNVLDECLEFSEKVDM